MKKLFAVLIGITVLMCCGCAKKNGGDLQPSPSGGEIFVQPTEAPSKEDNIGQAGDIVSNDQAGYGYDTFKSNVAALCKKYPSLLKSVAFGKSAFGRDLLSIVLGNENSSNKVVIVGGMGGSEYGISILLTKQIETYCARSNDKYRGAAYRDIFANCAIYFVPMLNPDGVEININGLASVPEKSKNFVKEIYDYSVSAKLLNSALGFKNWNSNGQGVDLNKNFGIGTVASQKIQSRSASSGYPSIGTADQPETKALCEYIKKSSFSSMLVYAGTGNLIDWYFGQNACLQESVNISSDIAALSGYTVLSNGQSKANCAYVSLMGWFLSEFDRPAFNVSVGNREENTAMTQADITNAWSANSVLPLHLAWRYMPSSEPDKTLTPSAPTPTNPPSTDSPVTPAPTQKTTDNSHQTDYDIID